MKGGRRLLELRNEAGDEAGQQGKMLATRLETRRETRRARLGTILETEAELDRRKRWKTQRLQERPARRASAASKTGSHERAQRLSGWAEKPKVDMINRQRGA
jgi:hypothetical protein